MTRPLHVLVTSVGRRGQLVRAFARATRAHGGKVFAADASRLAPAAYLADGWWLVPPLTSPDYIPRLLEICQTNSIAVVVPTIDTELPVLANAREEFEAIGTSVLVSSPAVVEIAADKRSTHTWLLESGIPTPRLWMVDADGNLPPDARFPVCIKPVRGSRSVGVRRVESAAGFEPLVNPDEWLVQEFIDGREFTVSLYVDRRGKCLAVVPRERLEVREGEVSKAATRRVQAVEDVAASIAERLPGAWGPLNVQIIAGRDGRSLHVIEINARFGGGDPLAWEAGADAPAWILEEVAGTTPATRPWAAGVAMLRFDDAVYLRDA